MATSLSEFTNGLRSKPLHEIDWWKFHIGVVALFVVLALTLTLYHGVYPVYKFVGVDFIARPIANAIVLVTLAAIVVSIVGSWIGYYFDAQYIATLDTGWTPKWWLYMIVHVTVVGWSIAIPVYLIQRMRHVGLPIFS